MLDERQVKTMQRIASSPDERFTLNETIRRIVGDGVGKIKGRSAYFKEADKQELRNWLAAKGYSQVPVDLTLLSRSETLDYSPNEKAGRTPLKHLRVAIKAFPGQSMAIGGEPLALPPGSYLNVDWKRLPTQTGHDCVVVVENFENFDALDRVMIALPAKFFRPLAVYHGDPQESRLDAVMALLKHLCLPVFAFMDADPAGLLMASRLPGLQGVIAPPDDILASQLTDPRTGRPDLFNDQYPVAAPVLRNLPAEHPCKAVWKLIAKHQAAVVQESWIGRDVRCITR